MDSGCRRAFEVIMLVCSGNTVDVQDVHGKGKLLACNSGWDGAIADDSVAGLGSGV